MTNQKEEGTVRRLLPLVEEQIPLLDSLIATLASSFGIELYEEARILAWNNRPWLCRLGIHRPYKRVLEPDSFDRFFYFVLCQRCSYNWIENLRG